MVVRSFARGGVVVVLLSLAGCGTSPQERLALMQGVLTATQAQAASVQDVIAQFEGASADARKVLADPNLAPETRARLLGYIAQIDQQLARYRPMLSGLQEAVAKIQADIAAAGAQGENLDAGSEIQMYGHAIGMGGAALPPPLNAYAGLIGLATTLVGGVVGSVLRGKKADAQLAQQQQQAQAALTQQKAQADTVVQGIVGSVNALLKSTAVPDPEAAKTVLRDYQVANCPQARAAVRQAQGSLA
jgi:hypothetical protein